MARYKKILAALDGADTQLAVARRTLSIAHDNNAEVLFIHVLESIELEQASVSFDEIVENCRKSIEEKIGKQLSRAMKDKEIASVTFEVKAGRITDTLDEAAREFEPDLVICGVRGLSGIKYAFVGSTSTHLTRSMACDVLVVRPESIDEIDEAEYEAAEKAAEEE